MSEVAVILCEGYHDRAFWSGWLNALGWRDAAAGMAPGGIRVANPYSPKQWLSGGVYRFDSPNADRCVLIVPCGGDSKVLPEARRRLNERETRPIVQMIINLDSDHDALHAKEGAMASLRQVEGVAREFTPGARSDEGGAISLDGTRLSLVLWQTDDAPTEGIPSKQTLERLVSAATAAAYPERAAQVANWLRACGNGAAMGPKPHSWSYMAGWFAEHGCEDFFKEIWRDDQIRPQLEARLRRAGAWKLALQLAAQGTA